MALITGGTVATTSLQGIRWTRQPNTADFAALAALIKYQAAQAKGIVPGAFAAGGLLDFAERQGFLNLKPGDYLFVDSNGWPIPVSSESIAAGGTSWAHS